MATTREFKETVRKKAIEDKDFRQGLLTESLETMFTGDIETGKSLLRDYINATVGFEELAKQVHKSPKSIMRMFSAGGNPNASNLFGVICTLQKHEGVQLGVHAI